MSSRVQWKRRWEYGKTNGPGTQTSLSSFYRTLCGFHFTNFNFTASLDFQRWEKKKETEDTSQTILVERNSKLTGVNVAHGEHLNFAGGKNIQCTYNRSGTCAKDCNLAINQATDRRSNLCSLLLLNGKLVTKIRWKKTSWFTFYSLQVIDIFPLFRKKKCFSRK